MKIFFIVTMCFTILSTNAQKADTIFFDKKFSPIGKENISSIPVYKLLGDSIKYKGKSYNIILPKTIDTSNAAFAFEYFTGWKEMFLPQSVILIDNAKGNDRKIYLDKNQNLDFTDDGSPLILKINDSVTISYPNSQDTLATFNIKAWNFDSDEEVAKRSYEFYSNHSIGKNNTLLAPNYWLNSERYNCLIIDALLDGDSIKIGLKDYDCNGFFGDKNEDRIMVGNYKTGKISDLKSKGTYELKDTTVIKINGKNYEVVSIDKHGSYIVLKPSVLSTGRLEIGDELPELQVKLLNDSTHSLSDLITPNKYTLIDIWGTWCAGCILQTKELKRLINTYNNLNILALNYGDRKETLHKYLIDNEISWMNGYASKEINEAFMVDSYPYLILIKDNKVLIMQARIHEIEEYLRNEN